MEMSKPKFRTVYPIEFTRKAFGDRVFKTNRKIPGLTEKELAKGCKLLKVGKAFEEEYTELYI